MGCYGSGDRRVLLILWVGAGGVVGAMARYLVVMGLNGGMGGVGVSVWDAGCERGGVFSHRVGRGVRGGA